MRKTLFLCLAIMAIGCANGVSDEFDKNLAEYKASRNYGSVLNAIERVHDCWRETPKAERDSFCVAKLDQLNTEVVAMESQDGFASFCTDVADRFQDLDEQIAKDYASIALAMSFIRRNASTADELLHRYNLEDPDHQKWVTEIWWEDRYTWPNSRVQSRHGLTASLARELYDRAMAEKQWIPAREIAQAASLPKDLYDQARREEVIANFNEALFNGKWRDALAYNTGETSLPADLLRGAALMHFKSCLATGVPLEAYSTAIRYDLGRAFAQRAEDAAFERALKTGAFTLARGPDGRTWTVLK